MGSTLISGTGTLSGLSSDFGSGLSSDFGSGSELNSDQDTEIDTESENIDQNGSGNGNKNKTERGQTKKLDKEVLRDFLSNPSLLEYHGQSSDEVALVYAAREAGYSLIERKKATGISLNENGEINRFPIEAILEFNSDRKRMSLITRDENGRLLLICKGADSMLIPRSKKNSGEEYQNVLDDLNLFAGQGLRTLLFGYRYLKESEFRKWLKRYNNARASIINREGKINQVCEEIETDLHIFAATGIEDKLQAGVPKTIDYLLNAGIAVWLLTGDKPGTAVSVGYSCKLIRNADQLFNLNEITMNKTLERFNEYYEQIFNKKKKKNSKGKTDTKNNNNQDDPPENDSDFSSNEILKDHSEIQKDIKYGHDQLSSNGLNTDFVLIITGPALEWLLTHEEKRLYELATLARTVIYSRVTPKQKSQVIDLVHKYSRKVTLAIGDGANDVSMIRTANVGIGVVSKEGNQAVRVSDFSLARFKHLKRLICVHGRFCYLRLQEVVLYSFYKNIVFILPQLWWSFFSGCSGQSLYDDWFMALFNMVFNAFPPLVIGFTEKDVRERMIDEYPQLYKDFQKKPFNIKKVIYRIFLAVFQSLFIYFSVSYTVSLSTTLLMNGKSVGLRTIGTMVASIAMIVSILDLVIRMKYWTWINHLTTWFSLISIYLFLWPYENIFKLFPTIYKVVDVLLQIPSYYFLLLFNIVGCLLPEIITIYIRSNYYPKNVDVLRERDVLILGKNQILQQINNINENTFEINEQDTSYSEQEILSFDYNMNQNSSDTTSSEIKKDKI